MIPKTPAIERKQENVVPWTLKKISEINLNLVNTYNKKDKLSYEHKIKFNYINHHHKIYIDALKPNESK